MMWDQRYKHQVQNKTFSRMRERTLAVVDDGMPVVLDGQALNDREMKKMKDAVEQVMARSFSKGFRPMDAVSTLLGLVTDQLSFLQHSKKRDVFEKLYNCMRRFERYFDKYKKYDDTVGLVAGEVLREAIAG